MKKNENGLGSTILSKDGAFIKVRLDDAYKAGHRFVLYPLGSAALTGADLTTFKTASEAMLNPSDKSIDTGRYALRPINAVLNEAERVMGVQPGVAGQGKWFDQHGEKRMNEKGKGNELSL